ncbi:MAG: hypothetical protein AAFN77_21805 [Planctomycetota bacterium]
MKKNNSPAITQRKRARKQIEATSQSLARMYGIPSLEVPLTLWMQDERIDDATVERIKKWHRGILKGEKSSAKSLSQMKLTLASIVDELERVRVQSDHLPLFENQQVVEDSRNDVVDEKAKFNQRTLNEDQAFLALTIAHSLFLLCHASNVEGQSSNAELTDGLWEIATTLQATNHQSSCLLKSLGVELAAYLCCLPTEGEDIESRLAHRYVIEEFESLIESQLDGDGWPASEILSDFGRISASWIRTYLLLKTHDAPFDFDIVLQIEWMVRQLLRMRRNDGSLCYSAGKTKYTDPFWQALVSVSDDDDDRYLARLAGLRSAGNKKSTRQRRLKKGQSIAEPFNLSEWASCALLRSSWDGASPRLAVHFSKSPDVQFQIDLSRKRSLLFGNAMPTLQLEGRPLLPQASFDVVCERCDDDLDYIELQLDLATEDSATSIGRLNRQLVLSRSDDFLLVIDTIVPPDHRVAKPIEYHCHWKFADNIEAMTESQTREIYLQTSSPRKKIQALVLPLSLPEWKSERFDGEMTIKDGGLDVRHACQGSGLAVPMVIDLNPKRSRKKRTWRSLTVAQDRQIVPNDHACAYRFQLDQQQWFFYRAIATHGNRTFLGENTNAEFVLNRFETDGSVTELIEVQ